MEPNNNIKMFQTFQEFLFRESKSDHIIAEKPQDQELNQVRGGG